MLTIVDLNRNEALACAEMGKVSGGVTCEQAASDAAVANAWASIWFAAGAIDAQEYHDQITYDRGYMEGACGVTPTN